MKYTTKKFSLVLCVFCLYVLPVVAQDYEPAAIKKRIVEFKQDDRGPYQAIRWFCPDGTIIPPKERCPQPGGIQHALLKDVVRDLAFKQHIFLGQILAGTDYEVFFDAGKQNSRLQQYQMEKYLQAADDGWIMRRARYYRGAVQVEDEEAWGAGFLTWLVSDTTRLKKQFYFVRQTVRDIPQEINNDLWQKIRGAALVLSDSIPSFMNLRVKIHGQPEISDIAEVKKFFEQKRSTLKPDQEILFLDLIRDMYQAYQAVNIASLERFYGKFEKNSAIEKALSGLLRSGNLFGSDLCAETCLAELTQLTLTIREQISEVNKPEQRLAALNLSLAAETIIMHNARQWHPGTADSLFRKHYLLTKAATGCGYLELWEWRSIQKILDPDNYDDDIEIASLREWIDCVRGSVEWGTAMVRVVFEPVIQLFEKFEPLASGFVDDRVRSSLLLVQGETADQLVDMFQKHTGISHQITGLIATGGIRGVNPGYALGELVVITGDNEQVDYAANKIYMLSRTEADLKPVAGIITVNEGNLVSHVQLLARNLGIPNAVFPQEDIRKLAELNGQKVFFAVSPGGTVVLKPVSQMNDREKSLVIEQKRSEDRIQVPLEKIDLDETHLISLRDLRADDSGKYCGPKAANLAELKYQFPENVVEGFVIPFGVYRRHLEQPMPGTDKSFWSFLQHVYEEAELLRQANVPEDQIETGILIKFTQLREAIKQINFMPDFVARLQQAFQENFNTKPGDIPVFIRSDTNMEDLKDFTGAGLNLTVFNVRDSIKIMQGIRDVWASPFGERSYRWRQKYLLNPENVYPSILIIPSVNVDKSGVMITTGIRSKNADDLTVAFNRGVGGAVEGQRAESYLLRANGRDIILSPSREHFFTELPVTGGTIKTETFFNQPILNLNEIHSLREISDQVWVNGIEDESGPLDIELGFLQEKLWLFQMRPFVESKKARSSGYLNTLDPDDDHIEDFSLDLNLAEENDEN